MHTRRGVLSGTRVALLVLALAPALACVCGAPVPGPPGSGPQGAAGFLPMAATGRETWIVDGESYDIQSTYYLVRDGHGMYTIEWVLPEARRPTREWDEATARELARPLMHHAVRQGLHRRQSIRSTSGPVPLRRIAVVLLTSIGARQAGYRTYVELAEIERELGTPSAR